VRLKAAEAALNGSLLASSDLAAAARASADAVTQTDDMNTSMSYRRRVLSGLIQRLVPIAASRARGGKRQ
jgi:CO/xanthine dehydrogenase FAD-binding subunit